MKNFKIAVATAALALASGSAAAVTTNISTTANSATGTIAAGYTLAAPLAVTKVTDLTMPTLVATGSSSVILSTQGNTTYSSGGSPGLVNYSGSGTVGVVNIDGQNGYTFDISATSNSVTGVTLDNFTFRKAMGTTDSSQVTLPATGTIDVNIGAKLSSTSATTTPSTSLGSGSFTVTVTVTYASV